MTPDTALRHCQAALACIALIAPPAQALERGQAWHTIRGAALEALFSGHELGDGVHYAYQFQRGGGLTGMNMGKPGRGSWRTTEKWLCYTWHRSGSQEECYEVRQRGPEVRMLLDGYEAFAGTLVPIDPPPSKEAKP